MITCKEALKQEEKFKERLSPEMLGVVTKLAETYIKFTSYAAKCEMSDFIDYLHELKDMPAPKLDF